MRTPARAALALALALATLAGCGGGEREPPALAWDGRPTVVRPALLEDDRILSGTIRNTSDRVVTVRGEDVRVLARGGGALPSSALFARAYAHDLYGADRRPDRPSPFDAQRLGLAVRLEPGETAPLTVSWRLAGDGSPAARIDWGAGVLPVPRTPPRRLRR